MFSVQGLEKPVVIMPLGLKFNDLCLILDFAYLGQAHVPHESLDDFLKAGELLQIRGIKERRLNFVTQQTMNRSFDSTISSTQETFPTQPQVKRQRDEDEISIQEASEIMKMLLESNPELEADVQEKTPTPNPTTMPVLNTSNLLPRAPLLNPPQINFFTRPLIPTTVSKKKPLVGKVTEKYPCQYCRRVMASRGRALKHENECNDNPNREIAVCDICRIEIKPSAMTLHRNSKHGHLKQQTSPDNSHQLPVISSSPSPRICYSPAVIANSPQPLLTESLLSSPENSTIDNVITFINGSPIEIFKVEKLEMKIEKDDEIAKEVEAIQ